MVGQLRPDGNRLMADREREKKKKRAYLDDFEKDLNGNYQYRGAHYRYAGEYPHSRVLALLWLFCGSGAALTVGAGDCPGPRPTHCVPAAALHGGTGAGAVCGGAAGAADPGRRARAGLYPRTDRTKIALFVQGDSGTLRCCLLRGRGWLCLQWTHSCFGECKVFLYFLNCSPALLLPLLRGSSSGCRGKKKNNYTLL